MKKRFLLLIVVLVQVSLAMAQSFNWGIKAGSTGIDNFRATAIDAQNNVYGLLFFTASTTIDSLGTPKVFNTNGGRDVLIVKYNCNKVFQWAVQVGGTFDDGGAGGFSDLIADTSGNIYVASTLNGSVTFVSANGNTTSRTSAGQQDGFLMKIGSNGLIQWINTMGGLSNDEATALAIDRLENIYIGGYHTGQATFTSTTPPNLLRNSAAASVDYFLVKYNPAGVIQYLTGGASNGVDIINGLAVDSLLRVFAVGTFGGGGNFNGFFGANALNNAGGTGGFLASFSAAGGVQWAVGLGGPLNETIYDVVVDDQTDRVFVSGSFQGTSTLTTRPGGTAQNLTAVGNFEAFIASFNLTGGTQWARVISGASNEYAYTVELSAIGELIVAGEFNSNTNFGGTSLTPLGGSNIFVARYTQANAFVSAINLSQSNPGTGFYLKRSPNSQIYLSGSFGSTQIFGNDTLTSAGSIDGFITRMQDLDTTFLVVNKTSLICTGDTANFYIPNKRMGTFKWYRNDTLVTITISPQARFWESGTYKVVSSNECATDKASATITLTRSLFYNAPAISSISVCNGDTGRLNASGAQLYAWFPSTGLSDSSLASPLVKVSSNSTYYLVRQSGICFDLDTVTVTLLNNCCLTCSSPYQLNQGAVACYPFTGNARDESGFGNNAQVFNAVLAPDRFNVAARAYQFNGFNSYLEVPNSVSLASPTNQISFTFWARVSAWIFNAGVQYTPILSKSNNTTNAQYRAMIRLNGAYAMTDGKSWNGVIGGATNVNTWYFFCITARNDTMFYYRNGTLLGFAVGPTTYTLNNTTPLRIGRNDVNTLAYFNGRLDELRIYNRTLSQSEITSLYNLSAINGLPTINAGTDKNICRGDSVQLLTSGTLGSYLWTPNVFLSSDTARSPFNKGDTSTTYVARVDYFGCKNYDTVRVNVSILEPDLGTDRTICLGDTATLIVSGGGNTFNWTPNYNISSVSNDTIQVFPTTDTAYVMATNNGVCTRRDTVFINVNTVSLNAGPDATVCPGDTAKFTVTSDGTVRWSPFTYLSDSIGTNVYSLPDTNITYVLQANNLGCLAYDTVSVITVALPVNAGTDKLICFGDSVQLQATGGINYIWLPNYRMTDSASATPTVFPAVPTYYFVASYNGYCARYDSVFVDVRVPLANAGPDKTICNGDSAVIGVAVNGIRTWLPATGIDTSKTTPYAKPAATTTYYLSGNNGGCMAYDTVTVTVLDFNINAGADRVICKGDSVQLNAMGGIKYNWLPLYNISDTGIANPWVKPDVSTPYLLLSTNGYCVRIDTVLIDVRNLNINAGIDTSVCIGESVKLNATGAVSYQWTPVSNIDNPTIASPTVTPTSTTAYIVLGFDGVVCQKYDTVVVRVRNYPTVNAGPDLKHCPNEFLDMGATASDYTRLEWVPASYLSDKLALNPQVSVLSNTTYVLNAWNGHCLSTDTVSVSVNPKVIAGFKADPNNGFAPLPVNFTNTSTNAYFFVWDFDDKGATSDAANPTYTYTSEGTYNVLLLAKDSLGCFDTISYPVFIREKENIFMPNAFSPNGDGLNDRFEPTYNPNKFEFVEYQIFNRWGVQIFSTKMPGASATWWDGKVNGIAEPAGVFTYVGTAKDLKGKVYELKGNVTLMR
jgi:gliding motility-associated-like protein